MIAPRDMGFGKSGALRYKAAEDLEEHSGTDGRREPVVVLGPVRRAPPGGLWSREPLATVSAEPRRFLLGVPLVFLVALATAWAFRDAGTEVALGALLVTQCLGFITLYVPAFRRRTDPMRIRLEPRNDPSPIDHELARRGDRGAAPKRQG